MHARRFSSGTGVLSLVNLLFIILLADLLHGVRVLSTGKTLSCELDNAVWHLRIVRPPFDVNVNSSQSTEQSANRNLCTNI